VPSQTVPALVTVAIICVIFGLMIVSWRSKAKRQAGIPEPAAVPRDFVASQEFEGLYLATTPHATPLQRITVHGLGFRAQTTVTKGADGFSFGIPGHPARFIPVSDIRTIRQASWTIDRGVGAEGLDVIHWVLGDTEIDTYFRFADPEGFIEATTSFQQLEKEDQ
jgi:hypothetical protein